MIGLDATDPAACRRAVSDLLTILATPAMADVPPVPALYPVQPPEAL